MFKVRGNFVVQSEWVLTRTTPHSKRGSEASVPLREVLAPKGWMDSSNPGWVLYTLLCPPKNVDHQKPGYMDIRPSNSLTISDAEILLTYDAHGTVQHPIVTVIVSRNVPVTNT